MSQIVTVGRRKRAIARVFLQEGGSGTIEINKRTLGDYFPVDILALRVTDPFRVLALSKEGYDIRVNVAGGGIKGQAEAIRLGISRALVEVNEDNKPALKHAGFMTRDSRKVERKKPGLKKARKSKQFSKR
ncbi:MAG: 30S ribosomal protein S9 [Bacteroidia bacterium]|nr:30S ribosomal protein S9 [Bacteroidia bacterium]